MSSDDNDKKPGPEPERLAIRSDPEIALGKLLKKNDAVYRVLRAPGGTDVSQHDSLEQAKSACESYWSENDCNAGQGDRLLVFEEPGEVTPVAVFRGVWE